MASGPIRILRWFYRSSVKNREWSWCHLASNLVRFLMISQLHVSFRLWDFLIRILIRIEWRAAHLQRKVSFQILTGFRELPSSTFLPGIHRFLRKRSNSLQDPFQIHYWTWKGNTRICTRIILDSDHHSSLLGKPPTCAHYSSRTCLYRYHGSQVFSTIFVRSLIACLTLTHLSGENLNLCCRWESCSTLSLDFLHII